MFRDPSSPWRWLALGLAFLSSGCASAIRTRTPLAEAHRQAIQSSRTVANVSQEEVGVSIEVSNAGVAAGASFGLIGALIGSAIESGINNTRAKEAEAVAAPIRTAMVGYDARAKVEAALTRELAGHPLLKATVLEQRRDAKLDRSAIETMLDRCTEDAVLLVDFNYQFTPTFDHLVVTTVASFLPTKKAQSPELAKLAGAPPTEPGYPRPLMYRVTAMTSTSAPAGDGKPQERWAADEAAAARQAIDTGIDEVVRLVVWDIDQPAPKYSTYEVSGTKPLAYKQLGMQREWYVVSTENGRTWLRARSGELASLSPEDASAPTPTAKSAPKPKPSEPAPERDPRYPKPRHNPGDMNDDPDQT